MATYSVNWSAVLSSVSGEVAVGMCLVQNSAGTHLVGTTANRASYGRCIGIAASAGAGDTGTPTVRMIEAGPVPASITGLATGTASWVRVSSLGVLERVTPGVGDDIIGKAHADGSVQLNPGVWDSTNFAGGGSGGDATLPIDLAADVDGTLPVANGGTGITSLGSGVATFLGTPSGANLAAALTTALPDTKGGTGLTALGTGVATFLGTPSGANLASALTTALPDTKGGTGLTALGTGVATFLGTPSGANLASALTTALPDSKGGTGLTALGTGVATFLGTPSGANLGTALTSALAAAKVVQATGTGFVTVASGVLDAAASAVGAGVMTFLATPSGANLASALTTALPDSKGGTGLTALGSGVATALGTFSSANIKAACTDETGSGGALVFATSPTLTTPVINGQIQGTAVGIIEMDISWGAGPIQAKTLASGANTFTFSNQASGMMITVRVTSHAGGSTLTWPTVLWSGGAAPTQTSTGVDVYTFVHDGTSIYGSVVQAMA